MAHSIEPPCGGSPSRRIVLARLVLHLSVSSLGACGAALWASSAWVDASDGSSASSERIAAGFGAVCAAVLVAVLAAWSWGLLVGAAPYLLRRGPHQALPDHATRLAPRFLRRLAAGALGLGVLTMAPAAWAEGPATAAATSTPGQTTTGATAADADATASGSIHVSPLFSPAQAEDVPTALVPATAQDHQQQPPASRRATDSAPSSRRLPNVPLSPLFGSGTTASGPSHIPSGTHVVLRGETLWSIAAQQLAPTASDAEVLDCMHRLIHENSARIATAPDDLLPGTVLDLPASRS